MKDSLTNTPHFVQWIVGILPLNEFYVFLFFAILSTIFITYLWFKYVKKPKGRGVIVPYFTAPGDLTPIEAGYMIDESIDKRDLAAELLYLDIKKVIDVHYTENNFKLVRKTNNEKRLNIDNFDRNLLNYLFGGQKTISLSSISDFNKSRTKYRQKIRGALDNTLKEKGYFEQSSFWIAFKEILVFLSIMFFIIFSLVGLLLYLNLYLSESFIMNNMIEPVSTITAFSSMFILIVGFFSLLILLNVNIKTKKGVEMVEKILGLKNYLNVAEKERLNFNQNPNRQPDEFNLLLPYAVALNIDKNWEDLFDDLLYKLEKLERMFYENKY